MSQRLLQTFTRAVLVMAMAFGSLGCATSGQNLSGIRSVSRVFTSQIKDAAAFRRYSKVVGGERFTKFIIDVKFAGQFPELTAIFTGRRIVRIRSTRNKVDGVVPGTL